MKDVFKGLLGVLVSVLILSNLPIKRTEENERRREEESWMCDRDDE